MLRWSIQLRLSSENHHFQKKSKLRHLRFPTPGSRLELKNSLNFRKTIILNITGCFTFWELPECSKSHTEHILSLWMHLNRLGRIFIGSGSIFQDFSPTFTGTGTYPCDHSLKFHSFSRKITILKIGRLLASLWPVWIVINHFNTDLLEIDGETVMNRRFSSHYLFSVDLCNHSSYVLPDDLKKGALPWTVRIAL